MLKRFSRPYNLGMDEQWKLIPNYGDLYQVSNHGNVRTNYIFQRGRPKLDKNKKPILNRSDSYRPVKVFQKTGLYIDSYLYVDLSNWNTDRRVKRYLVHGLVAKLFLPPPPNAEHRWVVNHIDGNKANAHIANLEWVSDSDNQYHRWQLRKPSPFDRSLKLGKTYPSTKFDEINPFPAVIRRKPSMD